jgi:F-type H+-transporting ATPase subunit gamma
MASLRDIRKRIRSVKNTRQITKAMKMVAAAKLRKAQDAIIAARPYAQMLDQIIADLVARSEGAESLAHPLLASRPVKKAEVVLLTSDRGLAGGFNSNVIRRASRFLYENSALSIELSTVGRKGNDFFRQRGQSIRKDFGYLYQRLDYLHASQVAQELSARFLAGEVDAVYVVYNEFVSAISQQVKLTQLLPLQTLKVDSASAAASTPAPAPAAASTPGMALVDFKYEPGRQQVLDRLVPQAVSIKLYRALLESVASEHGARMSAMDNATNNASDMIASLSLTYNRTRQAVITKELMEIVSGAEALK